MKNSFIWTKKAQVAFDQRKEAMINAPVLRLPYFSKTFIVECDASGEALRVVLMQKGQYIAYLSHALKGKNLNLFTYEKELLSLVMAVRKWWQHLLGQSFKVRTN